jgi:hypothetical protein
MAKQEAPTHLPILSTEPENSTPPAESLESNAAELTNRATATSTLLAEMMAQLDDRHYPNHWGINE